MRRKERYDADGVSEAIGFISMFTIVLIGITMVTFIGYPMLIDTRVSSDERSMEQAFVSLQNDMKILTHGNVPYRDFTMKVLGGELEYRDGNTSGETFTIDYYDETPGVRVTDIYRPGEILYRSRGGNSVISLMNGAVVRKELSGKGSVMIAGPGWFFDKTEKALVIFIDNFSADACLYETGIADIRTGMKLAPVTKDNVYAEPEDVKITYSPGSGDDYSTAWGNYMTGDSVAEEGFSEGPCGTYTFSGVERFVLKEYRIEIYGM